MTFNDLYHFVLRLFIAKVALNDLFINAVFSVESNSQISHKIFILKRLDVFYLHTVNKKRN